METEANVSLYFQGSLNLKSWGRQVKYDEWKRKYKFRTGKSQREAVDRHV
jgi:hypothetical protein